MFGELNRMNDLKEQAKKILAKGKELNDPDLIGMALEMLEAYQPQVDIAKPVESAKPTKVSKPKSGRAKAASGDITDQFRVNNGSDNRFGRKTPLDRVPRENKFIDDGQEFANLKGKTPPAQPKPKRKVARKNVVCRACGKKEKILASLIMSESEGYRCNNCILKGRF